MGKILFMNFSPNKEGNTFRIGEKLLEVKDYDAVQMSDYKISQYGQVFADDQIKKVFDKIIDYDTLVIGSPVYWYTVKLITFLANRLCTLMGMNLKGVCVDTADGRKILSEMAI